MQSDFRFENAQNLQETSCGNYEGTVDLEVGEEFGFYLYPLGDESDESTVLDNGCLHEGDARCPAFSSPSALAGIEQCTSKYSDPGSGDVFYNRVFDGETLAYNWGTCETTCANSGPPGCPQISTEPEVLDAQTCPISSGTGDAGYTDNYRGWYDASGCGICQDYCRWVGNSGSGGDPSTRTSSGDSFWSCRKAGGKASNPGTNQKDFCPDPSNTNIRSVGGCGTDDYSAKGYYGDTFTFEKCSGQGVELNPTQTTSTEEETQPRVSGLVGIQRGPKRTEYANGIFNVNTGGKNGKELQINSHRVKTSADYQFWEDVQCRETLYIGNDEEGNKIEVGERLETIFAKMESLTKEFLDENAILRAENANLRASFNALYAKVDTVFQPPNLPPPSPAPPPASPSSRTRPLSAPCLPQSLHRGPSHREPPP